MNAREQAREAVIARYHAGPHLSAKAILNIVEDADAASDVWEPFLRELVKTAEAWELQLDLYAPFTEAWLRAKEALGD